MVAYNKLKSICPFIGCLVQYILSIQNFVFSTCSNTKEIGLCLNWSEAQHNTVLYLSTKIYLFIIWLTDGLCCTPSCSSLSHHILSSHWHTVIACGRIWVWLKCVITPSSCACSNVHIECIHKRSTLESDLVLCDDSPWTLTRFHRVQWILEGTNVKNNKQLG